MTGPRQPGPGRPPAPPEWFNQARDRARSAPPAGSAGIGGEASAVEPGSDPTELLAGTPGEPTTRTSTTAGVVRAGALMAVATVVSRVTGLLSKIAILAILGVNFTSTAYTVANTLPNIVFELLIGGVLTSVAIPLLTRAQRSDPDGGLEYTQRLLTIAVVGLAVATVLAVLCAPLLARLYLRPGDAGNPVTTELTTQFGRFLLPQMFFYGIAALFGAILNTKERFAANAWAPVLNNVVVIAVAAVLVVLGYPKGEMPTSELLILGIGTTLGIAAQALVMIPALIRSGFRFRWRWGWDPRLSEAGGLVAWAIVYVLVSQVGVVITTNVANRHDAGGPTTFSYASLLFQMPYGILGVAVLTAIMPRLSRHAAAGRMEDVKDDVSLANRLSAVALLPVSAALVVLGSGLAVALFKWRSVTLDAAQQIGLTISAMALGLLPLAMTLVQMRVFYAMKDGRTPTLINVIMVAVRVPLLLSAVLLEPAWVIPGLALATAASYLVGAVVGEIWLRTRFGPMGTGRTLTTIGKMLLASVAGGAAAYLAVNSTVGITPTSWLHGVVILLVGGIVGLLVVALATAALRVGELAPVYARVRRLAGRAPAPAPAPAPSDATDRTHVTTSVAAAAPSAGSRRAPAAAAVPAGMALFPDRPALAGQDRTVDLRPFGRSTSSREQVTERVTHADPGAPRANSGPAGGRHAQPTVDPLGDETTARPGGVGNVDETRRLPPAPPVMLAPGATVGGRYRLVSLVTTDDTGNAFWRAKDTVLPRDMAVTLLPEGDTASATVARTLRVGRLHHIGLPQTLDVGTEQGQSYVVGQWVDGATLTDLLAGGPLEPDVATSITAKVSEAVAEAHRNGIALGAINPSLVRVNFDGQVRLSHVIAHGNATPDQDIRAVGGLLYLMLTGMWPLQSTVAGTSPAVVEQADPDRTVSLGTPTRSQLPAAPTRMGREVPANELRKSVPTPLSALAERALHPDDPSGIHAVGAIAALLRQPETIGAPPAAAEPEPQRPALNPAERRLVKERRVKLAVASVMIAAFSALIIIVVASLAKQVMDSVAGPTVTGVQKLTLAVQPTTAPVPPPKTSPRATPSRGATTSAAPTTRPTTSATTAPPASVVQKITDATVYDPAGDGVKDNTDQAPLVFDGNPQTHWGTFDYKQQFPSSTKPGVGLVLGFANPITPTSVTVTSDTAGTVVEIRAAAAPDLKYEQTTALGRGSITTGSDGNPGSTTIALKNAPRSKYLVVFVVGMAPDGQQFKSHINEVSVSGY